MFRKQSYRSVFFFSVKVVHVCQYLCLYACFMFQLARASTRIFACMRTHIAMHTFAVCVCVFDKPSVRKRGCAAVMQWHLSFAAVLWSGAEGRGQATLTETLRLRAHHVCLPACLPAVYRHQPVAHKTILNVFICTHTHAHLSSTNQLFKCALFSKYSFLVHTHKIQKIIGSWKLTASLFITMDETNTMPSLVRCTSSFHSLLHVRRPVIRNTTLHNKLHPPSPEPPFYSRRVSIRLDLVSHVVINYLFRHCNIHPILPACD